MSLKKGFVEELAVWLDREPRTARMVVNHALKKTANNRGMTLAALGRMDQALADLGIAW